MASDYLPINTTTLSHPLLWHGNQISHDIQTTETGYASLDDKLPGRGWPQGAVIELIHQTNGCGELSLLLPALVQLSQQDHRVVMIDPPWIPYPSALHGQGFAVEKLLLIRTQNKKESLWACEQVIRGIPGGAVLAWPDELSFSELRRLQLAAKNSRKSVFLYRDQKTIKASSPAELRLQLTAADNSLKVSILKCRGRRPSSSIHIKHSHLFQSQTPGQVNTTRNQDTTSRKNDNMIPGELPDTLHKPEVLLK